MTCSPSFLRISPWSTKTQVSWSPIGAVDEQRRDADESTPPDRPQMTLPSPTCVADALDLLVDDRRGAPRPCSQPQTSPRKRLRTSWP